MQSAAQQSRSTPTFETPIPTQWIGPVPFTHDGTKLEVDVPLATYETTLWPSTNRGAKAARLSGGLETSLFRQCMTRSIIVKAPSAARAIEISKTLNVAGLSPIIQVSSHHAKLDSVHCEVNGRHLFIRLSIHSGEASGHNMVTKAADYVLNYLTDQYSDLDYTSISGNMCVDKKVSAINGILGRGKHIIAETTVPHDICRDVLKTTAEKIHDLNIAKNYVGSNLAGSTRTGNAHFANLLLALYLATGQDAANIVEGSQGTVSTEVTNEGLYFAVNIPHLIVGTVGNGKHHPFIKENLEKLGCVTQPTATTTSASQKLAKIMAATIWCGEISLLAAQTNPGELMAAHHKFERFKNT